jgi:hypothetical protein
MREDTTPTPTYTHPPTDPIPALGDEQLGRDAAPGQHQSQAGQTQQMPPGPQADEPFGGPAGQAPAGEPFGAPGDPEPAPFDRPDSDLDADSGRDGPRGGFEEPRDTDPVPPATGPAGLDTTPDTTPGTAPDKAEDTGAVLFGGDEVERFRDRWRELQADFVDDPMQAVQGADQLIDEVMRTLTDIFAQHKQELESEWQGGGTAGETEELRVALRRYRSFFDQLLNA